MNLLNKDFTPKQIQIIREICFKQLDSLRRLYVNEHHSKEDILKVLEHNEISREDFNEEIIDKLERFTKLAKDPKNLHTLKDDDLSVFRHILTGIEQSYNQEYPKAVSNLWQHLFFIEKIREVTDKVNSN